MPTITFQLIRPSTVLALSDAQNLLSLVLAPLPALWLPMPIPSDAQERWSEARRGAGAHSLKYYLVGPCKRGKEQMASKENNSLHDVGSRNDSLLVCSCGVKFLHTTASELNATFLPVDPIFFPVITGALWKA